MADTGGEAPTGNQRKAGRARVCRPASLLFPSISQRKTYRDLRSSAGLHHFPCAHSASADTRFQGPTIPPRRYKNPPSPLSSHYVPPPFRSPPLLLTSTHCF